MYLQIWLTTDNIPIILHGGDDGELGHHFPGDDSYIFEKSYDELLAYTLENGEQIPKLETLIQLVNKKLFINFEVKAPYNPHVKLRYDYKQAV